jgi:(2Fe-2S) ferredoxin
MSSFIEVVTDDEEIPLKVGDSTIWYRRFDIEEYNRIVKRWTTKGKINRATGERILHTDDQGVSNDLLDYLIKRWENIKHPKTKKDVECTKEMKLKLPTDIRLEILDKAGAKDAIGDTEPEKKTSVSTPST